MSYMGAYVMWLEEEGLDRSMEYVERYHKENPHMIPPDRTKEEKIVRENLQSIAKSAEVLGWNKDDKEEDN